MYDSIIECVSTASKSIDIPIYSLFLAPGAKLNALKNLLINKAKESVKVRILVLAVKVNLFSQDMNKILEKLKET